MPYVCFAIVCTVWSCSFILMKKAALCFSPVEVSFGRILGGAAILALVCWVQRRRITIGRGNRAPFVAVAILGFVWPYTIQPWLISRLGSAFMGMTVGFTPLLTMLFAVPLLGMLPTRRQVWGVLGALVFLGFLMVDGLNRSVAPLDLALAMTVPASYAASNSVIRRNLRQIGSLELTLASFLAAGAMLAPLLALAPTETGCDARSQAMASIALVILGVVGTGLATWLFNRMIHEQGPLFAGMVTNLSPIGALAWGWLDAEPVTALQVVALAGLVGMVTLVQYGAATSSCGRS